MEVVHGSLAGKPGSCECGIEDGTQRVLAHAVAEAVREDVVVSAHEPRARAEARQALREYGHERRGPRTLALGRRTLAAREPGFDANHGPREVHVAPGKVSYLTHPGTRVEGDAQRGCVTETVIVHELVDHVRTAIGLWP